MRGDEDEQHSRDDAAPARPLRRPGAPRSRWRIPPGPTTAGLALPQLVASAVATGAVATAALAVVLRALVGDRVHLLRPLVYGVSLPLALLLALGAALCFGLAGHRRASAATLAAVLAGGAVHWQGARARHPCVDVERPARLRLLSWNVARGTFGYARVNRAIADADADLVVLAEADRRSARGERLVGERVPGVRGIHRR